MVQRLLGKLTARWRERLKMLKTAWFLPILAMCLSAPLGAQLITGSIVGEVVDPSGSAIPGANLLALNEATGARREVQSNETGRFVISGLAAGSYNLQVSADGFKTTEKTNLTLGTGERLSAGTIALTIGAVSEVISVKATPAVVKTESSERADLITSDQVDELMIQGRNPTDWSGCFRASS